MYAAIFSFMYYLWQVDLESTIYIYLSSWNIFIMYSPSIRSSIIFYLYTPSSILSLTLYSFIFPPRNPQVWCGVLVSKYLLLPSVWNLKLEAPRPSFMFISTWIFFIELNWISKVFLCMAWQTPIEEVVWFFFSLKRTNYLWQTVFFYCLCFSNMMSYISNVRFTPSEAEFKEFEPRLKFKHRLKNGWFH